MICKKCGVPNAADAEFCELCGDSFEPDTSNDITMPTPRPGEEKLIINDRFRIIEKLGKGGMGEIFLAEDVKLKRKVAVKRVLDHALNDPTSKERFLREAQTASQLDHTNICTIYEIFESGSDDYIVMQYIDGITLDHIIRLETLSIGKILDISIQICEGMQEAGIKKIVHRDLKPANIMLDKRGCVKILDFGLAKYTDRSTRKQKGVVDSRLTEKGMVMGTVSCISPEQARGQTLDSRSDLFSFGVVLFEMIDGKNPFHDQEQINTLYNVLNKEVTPVREIPEGLKKILDRCLKKDCNDRYPDFFSLKADLEAFRTTYREMKKGMPENGNTEKINIREQQELMKEIQKSTDKEALGDIVYRIKKFKAITEPVITAGKNKFKPFFVPTMIALALLLIIFVVSRFGSDAPLVEHDKEFYIYFHGFKDKTGSMDLADKINYLMDESLNQFASFKTISAPNRTRSNDHLKFVKKKFVLEYELKGTLSRRAGFYNIDAQLISSKTRNGVRIKKTITSTGENLDSFLVNQVDTITQGIHHRLFAGKKEKLELKKISGVFGTHWRGFSDLYRGVVQLKKLELSEARKNLKSAPQVPISNYYLADLFTFNGERKKAKELLKELEPIEQELTPRMLLRYRALKARLNFEFQEEIKNLEELKNKFGFSKEVYFELGEAYFNHRSPLKAMPFYRQALDWDPDFSMAINHLAYCYSFTGDHRRAIPLLNDYKNLDGTANSLDSLGDGYFNSGDLLNAELFKKQAVKTDEKGVYFSYMGLAEIYMLKAQYQMAEEALLRYVQLNDNIETKARIESYRAFMLYLEKDYEKAYEVIDHSLGTFDSDDIVNHTGEAHWIRGLIALALDKVVDARNEAIWLEKFQVRYKLSPENFYQPYKYLIHLKALLAEKTGEIEEADFIFQQLLAMKNKLSFWTYFNYQFFQTEYAHFLERNTSSDDALAALEVCLSFNNKYMPALLLKAQILAKKKDPAAQEIYKELQQLYGPSEEKNYIRNFLNKKK